MPSSTEPPRPAFGQVWTYVGHVTSTPVITIMLLCPTGGPVDGRWMVQRIDSPFALGLEPVEFYGLYGDRPPIAGYTYIEG